MIMLLDPSLGKMEDSALSIPDQRNYDKTWGLAYQIACETLAKTDFEQQCRNSEATCETINSRKVACLNFLNRDYLITLPDRTTFKDSAEEVPLRDKLLIMHYFLHAGGTPLTNTPMAFKELKEGANYFPTYALRAIKPLVDFFGKKPEMLLEVAPTLGGTKADYGDAAVTIPAFPRVPITLVLWKGDEEFTPEANILFDNTISDYLSTEDLIVLCQVISWSLVKLLPRS